MVPIHTNDATGQQTRVMAALSAEDSSVRLQAALVAGSNPDPVFLESLIRRCADEPDFFVRDMLSWALTRLPPESTLPRLRRELSSELDQARSQALHTLSKIGDVRTWTWITRDLLRDVVDDVARTAWRVAVVLVPEPEKEALAEELVLQLGRGDRSVQLSLSRALVDLGDVSRAVLAGVENHPDEGVAAHARATELLRENPEVGFDAAIDEARRVVRLGSVRTIAAPVTPNRAGEGLDETSRAAESAADEETTGC